MSDLSPILYWSHVPQKPTLHVIRMKDQAHSAQVLITCREKNGDEEMTIANVIVPFRYDLFDCSICEGKGWVSLFGGIGEECPWCLGDKRSTMDEAREIACALYWSWLRSPKGDCK